MGQVVKYKKRSVKTNYSVMSWRPKYPKLEVAEKYETESLPVMLSSPCGEKNPTAYWRMSVLDACLHRSICARLMQSDVWSHTCTCNNEQYPNSPDAASQLCAHTICKSLCHLSTFQQQCLKEDSHTPSPPIFPLSPSFVASSVSLSFMTKLLGGPVCAHWPLCLGWRKFTNS